MKKLFITAVMLLTIFSIQSCKKSPAEPDTEVPTYTWKGTLYKGLGEEVWANAKVELEAEERTLAGFKYSTVASGTTDAQGKFDLTYQLSEIVSWETSGDNHNCESVTLRANGTDIMEAPCALDLLRDFCSNDHCEVLIRIHLDNPIAEGDSIFINLKPINTHPGIKSIGDNVQALTGPISNGDEYQFKVGLTSCFNYCGTGVNLMWGKNNIQENQNYFNLTGFPYIDTIDLNY